MNPKDNQAQSLNHDMSFQGIILRLQHFWHGQGCLLAQPYDLEVGAGTSHPLTALYALGPQPWRVAYVQPCRRPGDGRYGQNPNRLQRYYQFQVLLKPAPENPQELLLASYAALGLDLASNDLRFVEDDWENPSLGAAGLGWEVWLNGMEVTQFTYFQQMGGIACDPVAVELTYGLERIAMALQNKDTFFDLAWNPPGTPHSCTYGQLALVPEQQFCAWYFQHAPVDQLWQRFAQSLDNGHALIAKKLPLPAYDQCLQANHAFNMLDARGAMSVTQRAGYIAQVRDLASACCAQWLDPTPQSPHEEDPCLKS